MDKWISGDYLLWPQKKAEQLKKIASSKPSLNWAKIPCTIKRKYIPSLEEAELEAGYLLGNTTDISDVPGPAKKKKMNREFQTLDLNYLFENQETSKFITVENMDKMDENIVQHCSSQEFEPSDIVRTFMLPESRNDVDIDLPPIVAHQVEQISYMMTQINNMPDTVNGQNACSELVDKFFDRKIMLSCSWTGANKSGILKYALKTHTNVLRVFYTIVKNINLSFNVKLMEQFLKTMTRNARKRSEAKGLRCSTIHRRPKKNYFSSNY